MALALSFSQPKTRPGSQTRVGVGAGPALVSGLAEQWLGAQPGCFAWSARRLERPVPALSPRGGEGGYSDQEKVTHLWLSHLASFPGFFLRVSVVCSQVDPDFLASFPEDPGRPGSL